MIFVIAPKAFYLKPYDDVTQGLGEYSSKTIDTQSAVSQVTQGINVQRMSLNEPWGHHIDGWATIQKSPTALTINLDLGYVLGSTPLSKWIGVQEGNFLEYLQALGASSRDVSWAATGFWGLMASLLHHPLFCI